MPETTEVRPHEALGLSEYQYWRRLLCLDFARKAAGPLFLTYYILDRIGDEDREARAYQAAFARE